MRRREFISLLSSTTVWPLAVRAQQQRVRRVAVLMNTDNADQRTNYATFVQSLRRLGWNDGQNVRLETRWAKGQASEIRKNVIDAVATAPDVILCPGTVAMVPLLQVTRTVPIVFVNVADPVGNGFVKTMARPGGNATGFVQYEYTLTGKWPELLKQIAPNVTRVAVLRDANNPAGIGQFAIIQAAASSLGFEVSAINEADEHDVERDVTEFARSPNGGLIVTASALSVTYLELIIALAARPKLPAVYYRRYFVDRGGLVSYGYDILRQFQGAADYVDRILKGANPAELPVQAPNKYDLVINLKTAKALGLTIPEAFLQTAEVIE